MTMEEKQAVIEKNLEKDPALKAEYQALAAELSSPEEAARKLGADPDLSARYAAIMAKVTNGMELDDNELDTVSGGLIAPLGAVQRIFQWLFGGVSIPVAEPEPTGGVSSQASTLGYDPSKGVSTSHAVYNPADPVNASPLGLAGGASGKIRNL